MITFRVNGEPVEVDVPPMMRLLDVLREELRLTGSKEGCGEGECGACSVLVEGEAVNSCLIPVIQASGLNVITVEGMASDDRLHPVQDALIEHGGAQCGICTPGFVVAAKALLDGNPRPSRDEVREALAGNLCRCTGYQKIIDAVEGALGGGDMKTSQVPVFTARSLPEALQLRAEHPQAMVLAGGTDVMVFIEAGAIDPAALLNIWGCDGLRGIESRGDTLRIGALTTWTDIARSDGVPGALRECARTVGAVQIQNRGTVGGNIVNASPAGDSLPLWLAWDAVFVAQSLRGERRIAATDFYEGYRKVDLAPDELLVAVELPSLADHSLCYRKVGTRLAQAISKVVLGARARVRDGRVVDCGAALGSVAPVPVRLGKLEAALTGQAPDPALAEHVLEDIRPIDDIRSTADYRSRVAVNIVRSWLRSLAGSP